MDKKTGIDAFAYYVPGICLKIEDLAKARGIEPAKLTKGLGLKKMALCDTDQDVVTMGAEALLRLIGQTGIDPRSIGRIYVGTESSLDSAKPMASYMAGIAEQKLAVRYGTRCLKNCDVVDMTFACIGAVDALQNSLDWVRAGSSRLAVVIASDNAKYEIGSTGEYTQGAGAVAMLVKENPRLLAVGDTWGVSMESVHDFFKPVLNEDKSLLLERTARLLGADVPRERLSQILNESGDGFWSGADASLQVHSEKPVFDGQYSNDCYTARIAEALEHFAGLKKGGLKVLEDWDYLVFHQPYAYQGRRMIAPLWLDWMIGASNVALLESETRLRCVREDPESFKEFSKAITKTPTYKQFVQSRIEPSERVSSLVGNLYTGSVFLSLVSLLRWAFEVKEDITGKVVGMMAYGSGSKSKVFEMVVEPLWRDAVAPLDIFTELDARREIDFETYEKLHKGFLHTSLSAKNISLRSIGSQGMQKGARFY